MVKKLIAISILASVLYISTPLQAATFNVATPAEFQSALTTAQANGVTDTINVDDNFTYLGRLDLTRKKSNHDLIVTPE